MAFIKLNYNKAGKGIEKNQQEKNVFLTYFGLYKRSFFRLMKANMLYSLASIPMIVILGIIFTMFVYPYIEPALMDLTTAAKNVASEQVAATYLGTVTGMFVVVVLLLMGSGPASAYFAHISKGLTTDEHVWIWSDFKSKMRENFKQGIIVSIIDIVVLICVINSLIVYSTMHQNTGSALYLVLFFIVGAFFVLYTLIHSFLYQMMVTFENKLRILYKNALILTIAKLPQVLCLTILPALISYYIFSYITPVLAALLIFLVWISLARFPMEFFAARTVKKIIDGEKGKGQDE